MTCYFTCYVWITDSGHLCTEMLSLHAYSTQPCYNEIKSCAETTKSMSSKLNY